MQTAMENADAEQLGVSVNTVYAYRQELQARFVKYFGYDPRNRGGRVVNYSGGSAQGLPRPTQEVTDDETTRKGVDGDALHFTVAEGLLSSSEYARGRDSS